MADERPKGLLHRIREKATDKLIEWLLGAIGAAVLAWLYLARFWIGREWTCVSSEWCTVSGWSLGLLIAAAVVITAAAAFLAVRLYRINRGTTRASEAAGAPSRSNVRVYGPGDSPPFQKIIVIDGRLKLRWFIIRPPKEWLPWRDIQNKLSPEAVQQVLDGPFHAVPGCNAPLAERWVSTSDERYLIFVDTCPSCGKRVFRPLIANAGTTLAIVFFVRAQALEELQRIERNGRVLDATVPVLLENPAYWKAMLPP